MQNLIYQQEHLIISSSSNKLIRSTTLLEHVILPVSQQSNARSPWLAYRQLPHSFPSSQKVISGTPTPFSRVLYGLSDPAGTQDFAPKNSPTYEKHPDSVPRLHSNYPPKPGQQKNGHQILSRNSFLITESGHCLSDSQSRCTNSKTSTEYVHQPD